MQGIIVDKAEHRMHIVRHYKNDMWSFMLDGHKGYIVASEDMPTVRVMYRRYTFRFEIDELVVTLKDFHESFEQKIIDTLKKYIDDHHIQFEEDIENVETN